jgi:hypothetical protein
LASKGYKPVPIAQDTTANSDLGNLQDRPKSMVRRSAVEPSEKFPPWTAFRRELSRQTEKTSLRPKWITADMMCSLVQSDVQTELDFFPRKATRRGRKEPPGGSNHLSGSQHLGRDSSPT